MSQEIEEVLRVLGMKPLAEAAAALTFGIQVLCMPSFDPECELTLLVRGAESVLSVHSARRSIWVNQNARSGTPGFGTTDSWVEPAVANETVRSNHDDLTRVLEALTRLERRVRGPRGITLDGMDVRVEVTGGVVGDRSFDLWFPADSETAPGRLVRVLWDVALSRCAWELTLTTLAALRKYC
jgi:hypothetical protein